MKKVWILTLSLLIAWTAQAGDFFVEEMQDVPLPMGAQKQPANDFEFGNDDTQLIEVYYVMTPLKFEEVKQFYRESMPQLGWKKQSESGKEMVFERGSEELTVAQESSEPLLVRLTLTGHPE